MLAAFWKKYRLLLLFAALVLGALAGWLAPGFASAIKPLGSIYLNLMLCLVVPLVFASIASSVANMSNRRRGGKILGAAIASFFITGTICAVLAFVLMQVLPPITAPWQELAAVAEVNEPMPVSDMLTNLLTVNDFSGLLSRKAMLPLIVFSLLFGLSVNLTGGTESVVGQFLVGMSSTMMKFVVLLTYTTPVAFFAIFANLVADYGIQVTVDYGRFLLIYYPLCVVYMLIAFPLYARFGGGKGAARIMLRHLPRSALTAFGTSSSVATVPTNLDAARDSGISDDVADMVIPLGATMHMDGACFATVIQIAFLMSIFGKPFEWSLFVPSVLLAVLCSVGVSGVPGGGAIASYLIASLFFPDQMASALAIQITIGNLIGPVTTMINSAGDYVVSFIVERFVDGKDWLQKALAKQEATAE